jgi:hypothetical protein
MPEPEAEHVRTLLAEPEAEHVRTLLAQLAPADGALLAISQPALAFAITR